MYFAYLTLPPIPEKLIFESMENLKLIGSDPRVDQLNKHRGSMNRATILTKEARAWVIDNITKDVLEDPSKTVALLNYTVYQKFWKKEETWGTHPKHIDPGRTWALNYYFDPGGDDTRITWHEGDTVLAETSSVLPRKWGLLKTDILHSVKNIEPERTRYFVSIDIPDATPLLKYIEPGSIIE